MKIAIDGVVVFDTSDESPIGKVITFAFDDTAEVKQHGANLTNMHDDKTIYSVINTDDDESIEHRIFRNKNKFVLGREEQIPSGGLKPAANGSWSE